MSRQHKFQGIPFPIVEAAIRGEKDALEKIWKDFERYINTLCGRPYQDAYGNVQYMIDQDMKDFMREQLYWAITHNFKMDFVRDDT